MATGTMESLWSKANQNQVAVIENGSTASRTYAPGQYFSRNGRLYRVTAPIASGGTFTPGTNCEITYLGTELYHTSTETTVNVPSNSDKEIAITPPTGFTRGFLIGLVASNDWNAVTIKTISAQGTEYPNRIKVNSLIAQDVSARIMWIK